jgi:hypothetical protein
LLNSLFSGYLTALYNFSSTIYCDCYQKLQFTMSSANHQTHTCGHDAHPASTRIGRKCPPCNLKKHLSSLQNNVEIIMSNGGWPTWRSNVDESGNVPACYYFMEVTAGYDKGKMHNSLAKSGWRNKRASLARVANSLEQEAKVEKAWEKKYGDTSTLEEKLRFSNNTASAALKAYEEALQKEGPLFDVQENAAQVRHKRARDAEVELAIEWGDCEGITSDIKAQLQDLPKRKRRCVERVQFHHQVSIRTDADIDTLRKASSFATNPQKTSISTRSILRTVTDPQSPSVDEAKPILAKPKVSQTVQPLNKGPYREKRSFNCRFGSAGRWAVPSGREVVNTSFSGKREDVWELREDYYRNLREEGEEWDARERLEVALASKTFPSVVVARMHMKHW